MTCLRSLAILLLLQCAALAQSEPQLLRESYFSDVTGKERDYFVYLPSAFSTRDEWPVPLFLHGNGERGDVRGELDFVLVHGPLYETWIQKRHLPLVAIGPQLPMYDMGDVSYITSRKVEDIPKRLAEGVPARSEKFPFTVEEDMNHDVWRRVYAGEDIYRWLLSQSK